MDSTKRVEVMVMGAWAGISETELLRAGLARHGVTVVCHQRPEGDLQEAAAGALEVHCVRALVIDPGPVRSRGIGQLRRDVYAREKNGRNLPRGLK